MPDPFSFTKDETLTKTKEAVLAIAPDYFAVSLPDGTQKHQERVLAYELYHQLRQRFDRNWYVNGEFRKGLSLVPCVGRTDWVIPDIVIHQPHTVERNLLVMEIKSDPSTNFEALLADVRKLEMYTDPYAGLNFSIGVMLAANFDFVELFMRASSHARSELVKLLAKGPRVAIWNVPSAISNEGSGKLLSDCLRCFRADDVLTLSESY